MLPSTIDRVPAHTAGHLNRRIPRDMEGRLVYYERHPEEIASRLEELDADWDIERMIEANPSTLAFTGIAPAATVNRKWIAFPALVTMFLFQHAFQGCCPPGPVLRLLGFRTAFEIGRERYALKAFRGDFRCCRGGQRAGSGNSCRFGTGVRRTETRNADAVGRWTGRRDDARRFYEQESFLPLRDRPMKLFLPMTDIAQLFG